MPFFFLIPSFHLKSLAFEVEQSGEQPSTVCNFPLTVVQDSMYLFSGQSGAKTSNFLFKFDFKNYTYAIFVLEYLLIKKNFI
jgi:hypothetical protein